MKAVEIIMIPVADQQKAGFAPSTDRATAGEAASASRRGGRLAAGNAAVFRKRMRPNGRLAEISAFPRQGSPMNECYDSVRPRGAPSEITHRATPLIASEFGFVTES